MNITDYLLENADDRQIALVDHGQEFSYADVKAGVAKLAAHFLAEGVQDQDRIGLLANNSLFWIAAYLATMKVGAVAVPFATTLTPEEFRRNLEFVNCRIFCLEKRLWPKFASAFSSKPIMVFEDALRQAAPSHSLVREQNFDPHSDAALMFTSGTTSRPRAVRITHRNIQANTDSIIEYLALSEQDRMMAVLPFYYCFGTSLLHTHLRAGGTLVISNSFIYPETVLDLMESARCTGFAGVPSTYQMLLRNSTFPKRKLSSLRKLQQAGGKLQNVLIDELIASQPQAQVFVMYGQTEATARLSYLPPPLLSTKRGSIGKGIPGVSLRVVGESGNGVRPDEIGEIIAKGDNISPGYLDDPEATAAKFVNGELRTGDLAKIDEDGFIYVVDRKADFIKTLGYRVSSQEIEACIMELADVMGTAAIGEPDLIKGEAIKVFTVMRKGATTTPKEIIRHCQKRLARHMVPQEVVFVSQLPMNAHGKVVKSELRKSAAASTA